MSSHDVQTAPATTESRSGKRRMSGGAAIAAGVAVLLLVAVLVVVALTSIDGEQPAEDLRDEQVPDQVYSQIEIGQGKEDVLRLLRPAEPLDAKVLDEFEAREPETPAAECLYFESEGGTADDTYRFCFVQDELVDKTVILPDNGVTGS